MFNLKDGMMDEIDFAWEEALEHAVTDSQGTRCWRDVVFAHPLGFRPLTLYISVPKTKMPPPLVAYIHGGAWFAGHPTLRNAVYRKLNFIDRLVAAGFAVARISYRFSGEGLFPMCLHDCKAAVRYLRAHVQHFGFDPTRIAAFGESAGGHLACLLALTNDQVELEGHVGDSDASSAVQAAVSWFAPTNFLTLQKQASSDEWQDHNDARSPESLLIGGPVQSNRAAARAASPISYVTKHCPPLLLQHGTADRLVPVGQALELQSALEAAGAPSTLQVIQGADHCFWGIDANGVVDDMIMFLKSKLAAG